MHYIMPFCFIYCTNLMSVIWTIMAKICKNHTSHSITTNVTFSVITDSYPCFHFPFSLQTQTILIDTCSSPFHKCDETSLCL